MLFFQKPPGCQTVSAIIENTLYLQKILKQPLWLRKITINNQPQRLKKITISRNGLENNQKGAIIA